MKLMSLRAFVKLWDCDAEWEPDGDSKCSVIVWEPLNVDVPPDARPFVYGIGEIDFYDCMGNTVIAKRIRFHSLNDSFPNLILLPDGVWRETTWAQVVWREHPDRTGWYVMHRATSNTRAARMANAGMEAYRS